MKELWFKLKNYFKEKKVGLLIEHISEVLWLTGIAFLPLILNIVIAAASLDDFPQAVKQKIIPGEMLSYCLSFVAPSLYLLIKTHGQNYKLPYLKLFTFITYSIYLCSVFLVLIAKNKWVPGIDLEHHEFDLYFKISVSFLIATIILRVYSTYHGSYSNWSEDREDEQDDFNAEISSRIV